MTPAPTFALSLATEVLDLPTRAGAIQRAVARPGPESGPPDSLSVVARPRGTRGARAWDLTWENEPPLALQRLLSVHELGGYGTRPVLWKPPREADHVAVLVQGPVQSTYPSPGRRAFTVRLVEAI